MTTAGKVLRAEVDHCSEEGCFGYVESYTSGPSQGLKIWGGT